MENIYDRTRLVLGEHLDSIQDKNILLLGVGGVGGYCLEMLVRMGIRHITVVDCDVFSMSNLNRQVLSTLSTIGDKKVDVAVHRAGDINPDVHITPIDIRLTSDNISGIATSDFDYIIDAIDDTQVKVSLMRHCKENNIPLLSSMGTGNRFCPTSYEVVDISCTSYDKLARKIRLELKKYGIYKGINVCYTQSSPVKTQGGLGSVVYHPLSCAGVMVSYVINDLLNNS